MIRTSGALGSADPTSTCTRWAKLPLRALRRDDAERGLEQLATSPATTFASGESSNRSPRLERLLGRLEREVEPAGALHLLERFSYRARWRCRREPHRHRLQGVALLRFALEQVRWSRWKKVRYPSGESQISLRLNFVVQFR